MLTILALAVPTGATPATGAVAFGTAGLGVDAFLASGMSQILALQMRVLFVRGFAHDVGPLPRCSVVIGARLIIV